MRSLWKGAVSFGLVHIPVKVYPATGQKTSRSTSCTVVRQPHPLQTFLSHM